jgi:Flp pilus assembly protein TadG
MMTPKRRGTKSIAEYLRRFAGCRGGTSSVEFVLVLGPMVLFLFGIIGFGLITFAHNNMVNAAREATRRLSVAETTVVGDGVTYSCDAALDLLATSMAPIKPAQKIACDNLTGWGLTFNVTATECDPVASREVTVTITTIASDAFMVDLWGLFTGNLEAEVTMRREAACA